MSNGGIVRDKVCNISVNIVAKNLFEVSICGARRADLEKKYNKILSYMVPDTIAFR